MDRYAVVGNPVAHSRSPTIHTLFAAQCGADLHYGRLWCPLDGFEPAVRGFAADGALGCNVTMPFKFEAFGLVAQRSARAQWAMAANVLRFDRGGWFGDNTDGIGLVRDLVQHAGRDPGGRRVLLVGAGGAAAGVLAPLLETGPAELVLANRRIERAAALVERHQPLAQTHRVRLRAATLALTDEGEFDLVINASSSSLAGAVSPIPARCLRDGGLAMDLAYGPAARIFLDWAEAHGAVGRDGLGMLVEQAAEAFHVWRGVRPQTAPVLAALRAEVQAEVA